MNRQEQRTAFLKALAEDRFDRGTHLVFAGWLEEHGDQPGDDDLAVWHRAWTPERQEAEDWMRGKAAECGQTCLNYGEHSHTIGERYREWDAAGRPGGGPDLSGIPEEEWVPITYEMMIQAGHNYLDHDDYFTQHGTEHARSLMNEGGNRELFWKHWQTLTGRKLGEDVEPDAPFSCSC